MTDLEESLRKPVRIQTQYGLNSVVPLCADQQLMFVYLWLISYSRWQRNAKLVYCRRQWEHNLGQTTSGLQAANFVGKIYKHGELLTQC
jgi:hypothetical protein